jgi:hypothetical protein
VNDDVGVGWRLKGIHAHYLKGLALNLLNSLFNQSSILAETEGISLIPKKDNAAHLEDECRLV